MSTTIEQAIPFTESFKYPGARRTITFSASSYTAWVHSIFPQLQGCEPICYTQAHELAQNVGRFWFFYRIMPITLEFIWFAGSSSPRTRPPYRELKCNSLLSGFAMKLYAWRDRFDSDMISLGTNKKHGGFLCWGQMHIDGIAETFGEEVKHALGKKSLMSVHAGQDCQPICIEASSLVVDGEKCDA